MQTTNTKRRNSFKAAVVLALFASSIYAMPAFAAGGVLGNIPGILEKFISALTSIGVAIITIAVIFSGYQIAFNHKRLTDVAPVAIGGLLIGSAAALAGLIMNGN